MTKNVELAKRIAALEALLDENLEGMIDTLAEKFQTKLANLGLGEHVELSESVRFFSKEYDLMKAKQAELIASNNELLARNTALEKRVAELEQYSRLNNVEIKGVPVTEGEDCHGILQCMANAIECPVEATDIDIVHRVPTMSKNQNEKNIIVRFCSREKKNDFIRKARKARLCTSNIGFSGKTNVPVFVNEHLTVDNKKLFSKALALKKEHNWKFLWTDNCRIKARKSEDGRVFRIATEHDLRVFT